MIDQHVHGFPRTNLTWNLEGWHGLFQSQKRRGTFSGSPCSRYRGVFRLLSPLNIIGWKGPTSKTETSRGRDTSSNRVSWRPNSSESWRHILHLEANRWYPSQSIVDIRSRLGAGPNAPFYPRNRPCKGYCKELWSECKSRLGREQRHSDQSRPRSHCSGSSEVQ